MRGKRSVCRCSQGHLFTHSGWWWVYAGTFTVVRLGFGAYMHCPVGNHWALVRPVKGADLAEQERQTLKLRERLDDQDGVKLNSLIGLVSGLIELAIAIVIQNWWPAALGLVWVMLWGPFSSVPAEPDPASTKSEAA